VLVVTAATARERDLTTVSDLGPVASQMTLGGPPECPQRPYCLPGLRRTYGLDFRGFDPLDAGGPYTVAALDTGQVQVAMMFSTDAAILENGFRVLRDDKGLQQSENVTPFVRDPIVDAYGARFTRVVNAVSAKLDTAALADLNLQVALGGRPASVAVAWLKEQGIGS
jgi:osmoprotectant transport system substrate-binding protein